MSAHHPQARNDETPTKAVLVTGMPAGYSISVEGERVAVVRPDGGLSEWHSRPDTNGSGMYDLCLALAALPSVTAGPSVPRLTEEGPVGEAFLALRALWDDEDQSPSWPGVEPLLESLAAALSARSGVGGLEVRTLDWRFRHEGSPRDNDFVADSPFGRYVIRPRNGAGAGFVALWVPDAVCDEAVTFPDARLAKAAALRDLVGRVRSCFEPPAPVRSVTDDMQVVGSRQCASTQHAITHSAEERELLRLDLADARRELARANGIVSLAHSLVSHGDMVGFDASIFDGCATGLRDDFDVLRRAIGDLGSASAPSSSTDLRLVSRELTASEVSEVCYDINRRTDRDTVSESLVRQVYRTAVFVSGRHHPDLEAFAAERLRFDETLEAVERRVGAMDDYLSHHGDWRRACEIARDAAGPSGHDHDHDDRGYWQHQIDTLDRVEAALRREGLSAVRHRTVAGEAA